MFLPDEIFWWKSEIENTISFSSVWNKIENLRSERKQWDGGKKDGRIS